MHTEDGYTFGKVGEVDVNLTVEAPGTQQGGVQDVHAVGGGKDNHTAVGAKAVHLREELVEGTFAFVVATEIRLVAASTPDGIDFVDEDDAWRLCLCLFKKVAHTAGTDADKHLHEVGT